MTSRKEGKARLYKCINNQNFNKELGHDGKVGPSPGTPGPPGMPTTLETPSNLRDPLESLRTQEFPWDHPGTTGIPRNVMREKDFSGIIISFLLSKKLEFFNHKNCL